ncbi:MAG: M56 family metallopeptidase, partial [Flavitalea sp.]
LPYLSVAYLGAILYLFIRLYRQYYITQKLFSSGIYKVNPELRVFLRNIAAQMGIKKNVSIWLSDLVDTPLTIGFWKPVILLPVAAINHLTIIQAEAVVLHELNHIRRNDYFINLLIACMDIILFFNPFVRIMTHIIKNERENSCDDMVLQFRYDAGQYANALLLLEKNRLQTPQLTINATGKNRKLLLNRVERILNKKPSHFAINEKLVAYLLSAFLMGFIGWYNPGKAIVSTIDTVKNSDWKINPEQFAFQTPKTISNQTPVTSSNLTNVTTRKKKSQQTSRVILDIAENPLEEFAEWISDQRLEATKRVEEIPSLLLFTASEDQAREYSIPEAVIPIEPAYSAEVHPYIPSTSFSYQVVEDTALPKKYFPTQAEIKAKESMATALKALQEIDWQKLEKEMTAAGKKIDIIKLQQELKKAMTDVDWKKIHEEMQASLIDAENQLMQEHSSLRTELQKYQKDRTVKQAERQRIHQAIIQEHLCEEKIKESKPVNKKTMHKKKIVYI